jgi:hypothetical protein
MWIRPATSLRTVTKRALIKASALAPDICSPTTIHKATTMAKAPGKKRLYFMLKLPDAGKFTF